MKNQYVGDIGDYTKLGLLRTLEAAGLSIGLNWYLTPDDNSTDGRHIGYLDKPCDTPDAELYNALRAIAINNSRSIHALENENLLQNACYFNRLLDFSNVADKAEYRNQWQMDALNLLKMQDIVFLDPDNGLEVSSNKPLSKNGNKYATYEETADYYRAGSSVIVYNHRDRSPESRYIERFMHFKEMNDTAGADIFCLKASRFSVRDYVFLAQDRHTKWIRAAIDDMLKTGWQKYLSFRDMNVLPK